MPRRPVQVRACIGETSVTKATGPLAGIKVVDITTVVLGPYASQILGDIGADGAPRYFPMVLVDKLTGSNLASMVGMALFHRERTGEGQEVHVPMLETILSFALVEHFWHGMFGEPEKGVGYPRVLSPHRRP